MTADAAAWAGVALVASGMLAATVAWLFNTNIRPLKTVIENNTIAMNLVSETIAEHTKSITDHELRINDIETTHEILDCKHNRRKQDKGEIA